MIPVPGLEQVKVMWVLIEKEGYRLYGFLLYTMADKALSEYIRGGIFDLDLLSGDECAIFLIKSPSKEWIRYSQTNNHAWWKLYGNELSERAKNRQDELRRSKISLLEKNIIENNHDCTIVIGDGNSVSLWQIIEPELDLPYQPAEALRVARHFGLKSTDVPCLIFFQDLNSNVIWRAPLGTLNSSTDVKMFFREFFESTDYRSLISTQRMP